MILGANFELKIKRLATKLEFRAIPFYICEHEVTERYTSGLQSSLDLPVIENISRLLGTAILHRRFQLSTTTSPDLTNEYLR